MQRLRPWLSPSLAALLSACGDGSAAATDGATSTSTSGAIDLTAATTGDSPAPTTTLAPTTGGETDTGGPPAPTFCAQMDVSLVLHPSAKIYGAGDQDALVETFEHLVEETGATIRILPNVGTEFMATTDCLPAAGNAPDDPILVFGAGGEVAPGAADALRCTLDRFNVYASDFDVGNYMFSGLMFPVLERADWPAPGATGLAMLVAATDDKQSNMYAQPGQASEAYLRLVGEGDRRRVSAFTYGDGAPELNMFSLAVSDKSRHYEKSETSYAAALADFAPLAVRTCEDFDYEEPDPDEPPTGCKRIDLLFAIDGSGSMDEEQDALRGANGMPPVLAEFTDALLEELTDVEDFHVGVVSSEQGYTAMHTHRDFPMTPESPETDCGLPPGQRWLVGPSPGFADEFACVAATRSGTEEMTYYNLAEALHDPANDGFLRDDSLVFIVILTDEDTYDFVLDTSVNIRQRVVDAVGGDLERLVVLAIAGGQGVFEMPETVCQGVYGDAAPGRRIISITRGFRERGLFQNICQGDLAATFSDVLDDVVSACAQFEPQP
ncbi:hypothetical protein [Nannocystis punicea]|uniref:VWFA domain-containing protein n=1 Tax=Nannocystis punicea TaxID=2995304 RepID=A0ABY7H6J4_9BACT|nr:hypothetical protein [Nannocystis poenicansa]WAS94639.1 hypothetical protein O0S08_00630 [Nannocystis poenicansa]